MFFRWYSTVLAEIPRAIAICLLLLPCKSRLVTSFSRSLNWSISYIYFPCITRQTAQRLAFAKHPVGMPRRSLPGYLLVGWTRRRQFDGTNSKPHKCLTARRACVRCPLRSALIRVRAAVPPRQPRRSPWHRLPGQVLAGFGCITLTCTRFARQIVRDAVLGGGCYWGAEGQRTVRTRDSSTERYECGIPGPKSTKSPSCSSAISWFGKSKTK